MRTDLIRLWLTVALAGVLAVATVAVFRVPIAEAPGIARQPGALLFQAKGCSGCHSIDGVAESATIGPNLTHLADRAEGRIAGLSATAYVTQSIREPWVFTAEGFGAGIMPTLDLSDAEVETLVAFLLTER